MRLQRTSTSRIALWLVAPIGLASLLAATSVATVSEPAAAVAAPAPAPAPEPAAPPATTPDPAAAGKYIGAAKCKNCHSAEKTGNQYGQWEKMLHAKAFETLASDKAKELAKAKGIDDPQKADACLKCHVTAFGEPADNLAKGFKPEMGVQCESCHGPAESHMKARMAAAAEKDPAKVAPVAAGEINAEPNADTCLKCHNPESPSYKPFCFKEQYAKISHLNPEKKRTPEELKQLSDPYGCEAAGSCQCPKPAAAAAK
jgi:mono/diheme cytochrome c family protein